MDQLTSRVRNKGRTTGSYIEFVGVGKGSLEQGRGRLIPVAPIVFSHSTGPATGTQLSHPV